MDENIYAQLGKRTEEMYLGLRSRQRLEYRERLWTVVDAAWENIRNTMASYAGEHVGKMLWEQNAGLQQILGDYGRLRQEIKELFEQEVDEGALLENEHFRAQLGRLRVVEKEFQQKAMEHAGAIAGEIQSYDSVMERLETAAGARIQSFGQEKEQLKEYFRRLYYDNLKQQGAHVDNLDNLTDEEWKSFFQKKVFGDVQIKRQLEALCERHWGAAMEELRRLAEGYVAQKQGEWNGKEPMPYTAGAVVDKTEQWLRGIIGKHVDNRRKGSGFLSRLFKTPMDRAKASVDVILQDICDGYELEGVIGEYKTTCEQGVRTVMAQQCAPRETAERIGGKLERIAWTLEKREIKQSSLMELLVEDGAKGTKEQEPSE